jgi:hypothetical protein
MSETTIAVEDELRGRREQLERRKEKESGGGCEFCGRRSTTTKKSSIANLASLQTSGLSGSGSRSPSSRVLNE